VSSRPEDQGLHAAILMKHSWRALTGLGGCMALLLITGLLTQTPATASTAAPAATAAPALPAGDGPPGFWRGQHERHDRHPAEPANLERGQRDEIRLGRRNQAILQPEAAHRRDREARARTGQSTAR
jgi:Spy/CpxP family protein refolding chaperone